MPVWLVVVSWVGVALGILSAVVIALDIAAGHRQHMWIMNVVWPLTALYSGLIGLAAYYRVGRRMTRRAMHAARCSGKSDMSGERPLASAAALGATHCGSGCCLGDLLAESLVVYVPVTLFGQKLFGTWAVDYVLAFAFGIAFQYFTIKPMRGLGVKDGLEAAVKADAASLTAWQVGMYGWMALATFAIFGHELDKASPVFWFMMQIAMMAGFLTAWPVNAWLIGGVRLGDIVDYMFDPSLPLLLRAVSLFHVALPIVWIWLLRRWRYDGRALLAQTLLLWTVLVATRLLTPPDMDVNWVFMPRVQGWKNVPELAWLAAYMAIVPLAVHWPMHALLRRCARS